MNEAIFAQNVGHSCKTEPTVTPDSWSCKGGVSFLPQLTALTLPGRMSMNYEETSSPKMHGGVPYADLCLLRRRANVNRLVQQNSDACLRYLSKYVSNRSVFQTRPALSSLPFPRHTFNYISQVLTKATKKKKKLPHHRKPVLAVAIATDRTRRTVCGTNKLIYEKKHHQSWKLYPLRFHLYSSSFALIRNKIQPGVLS